MTSLLVSMLLSYYSAREDTFEETQFDQVYSSSY